MYNNINLAMELSTALFNVTLVFMVLHFTIIYTIKGINKFFIFGVTTRMKDLGLSKEDLKRPLGEYDYSPKEYSAIVKFVELPNATNFYKVYRTCSKESNAKYFNAFNKIMGYTRKEEN